MNKPDYRLETAELRLLDGRRLTLVHPSIGDRRFGKLQTNCRDYFVLPGGEFIHRDVLRRRFPSVRFVKPPVTSSTQGW